VLVPGAPAGVTGDSIEYGGVLITTTGEAISGLQTFNDALLLNVTTVGVSETQE
jgi:hypothetical protein